jgi:hypothetical protein
VKRIKIAAFLFGLGLIVSAVVAQSMRDEMAVMDSLRAVHPRLRNRWLNERGRELPGYNAPVPEADRPDSSGLRLVGKYGRGPSVEVTGKDSLVFLSLGSEVAIINFSDTANPHVLAEVQAMGLVTQAAVRDSFLYVGCNAGQAGIEVWNVHDPTAPAFRSRTPTLLSDFCVRDTFLYLTQSLSGPNDTFKIYSIANPENVYLLGSCRDSGDAVAVTNNAAFIADRWGLYSIDVTDPRNPHHVGTYPGMPISVEARGNICCVTFGNPNQPEWLEFDILDVSNPASMQRLGFLSDAGGFDLYLEDTLVFVSGGSGHGFQVIGIGDSTHLTSLFACTSPDGWGTWANPASGFAALADGSNGLVSIEIRDLHNPLFGPAMLAACPTYDISVAGSHAFLANLGLKVLDLADPTKPFEVGHVDSARAAQCVAVADSFAFVEWHSDFSVASALVSDPTRPVLTGRAPLFNSAEDMVLRDTFLYIAEDYKFQIVNVARPREPVVVGTCGLPERTRGLFVKDTFAYVAQGYTGLVILSVARPDAPSELGRYQSVRSTHGVWIVDTIAYIAEFDSGLTVASVANPQSAYKLGSRLTPGWAYDVIVVDSVAYVSCYDGIRAYDVRNPRNPIEIGFHATPTYAWRLNYGAPYIYLACADAGVAIYETCAVGIAEAGPEVPGIGSRLSVRPNPARGRVLISGGRGSPSACIRDALGRVVLQTKGESTCSDMQIDISSLPVGLYFVEVGNLNRTIGTCKFIKD